MYDGTPFFEISNRVKRKNRLDKNAMKAIRSNYIIKTLFIFLFATASATAQTEKPVLDIHPSNYPLSAF